MITEHIKLDFAVDFDAKVFDGNVVLEMKVVEDGLQSVFLDSVGMDISKVEYQFKH